MKSPFLLLPTALIAVSVIALSGCSKTVVVARTPGPVVVAAEKSGPPPHAPAHGYRHKHKHGAVLVFDAHLGVYTVRGHKNLYYYNDRFFRLRGSTWYVAKDVDGKYKSIKTAGLPPGLQKQSNGKGKGHWKAKKVK